MTDMFQAARSFMRYALEDGISEKALRMALQQEAAWVTAERCGHSRSSYIRGCRCRVCTAAQSDYSRAYRAA